MILKKLYMVFNIMDEIKKQNKNNNAYYNKYNKKHFESFKFIYDIFKEPDYYRYVNSDMTSLFNSNLNNTNASLF